MYWEQGFAPSSIDAIPTLSMMLPETVTLTDKMP